MALQGGGSNGGTYKGGGRRQSSGGSFAGKRESTGGSTTGRQSSGGSFSAGNQTQKQGGSDYGWVPGGLGGVAKAASAAVGGQKSGYSGGGSRAGSGRSGGGGGGGGGGGANAAASAAAARQKSIQNAWTTAQNQNASLYDAAWNQINGRKNDIKVDYRGAINDVSKDADHRNMLESQASTARINDQAAAAKRMGLTFIPNGGGRADTVSELNRGAVNKNELAWRGLLNSQQQTAIERNSAAADVFKNSKIQEAAIIRKQMLASLGLA